MKLRSRQAPVRSLRGRAGESKVSAYCLIEEGSLGRSTLLFAGSRQRTSDKASEERDVDCSFYFVHLTPRKGGRYTKM